MDSIGRRIKAARKAAQLSQAELARRVGVTPSAVSQLETGLTHDPKPDHLLRYAQALRLDVSELITGKAAPSAAEPPACYAGLSGGERLLIDYIRGRTATEAERDALARRALALLLAAAG